MMSKRVNKGALLGSTIFAGAVLLAAPAFAQGQPVEGVPEEVVDDAPATQPAPETGAEIVVTGSRIARPDLTQSSPVAVISNEEFQLQSTVNVEDVINTMPQVIPSTGGTGVSNNPGGGVATVNLRNLGTQRTLVLVDGRRYIYFSAAQVTDLNTIPSALIERIDVVTGGRSAVYGSDAIAGVVNFITKRDFAGAEFNANYELTSRGDGARYNIDATLGANFDDGRGNAVVHIGYYERDGIYADQRDFTQVSFSEAGAQGSRTVFPGGSSLIPEFRFTSPNAAFAAALGQPAGTQFMFDPPGSPRVFDPNADLYNFAPDNYIQVPQQRWIGYGAARYEISEAIQPYITATFSNNKVPQSLAPTPIGNTTPFRGGSFGSNLLVHVHSPFLSPEAQAAFQAADAVDATPGDGYVAVGAWGRRFQEFGPRVNNDDRNAYRLVAGVEGEIGGGWRYDVSTMWMRNRNSAVQEGNIRLSALIAGVQTAFQHPDTGAISVTPFAGVPGGGNLVCADAGERARGCVPINLFGIGQTSPEAVAYATITASNLTEVTSSVQQAILQNNNLFDLGAGGIGLVLGAERREEFAHFQPDTFLASGDVGGFNAAQPTRGSYDVLEFFAETNIPLLRDMPFANLLELNGAIRHSNYSNAVGNVVTWAAGGLYKPVRDLAVRGQYQRAIRGPSVNELFLGNTVSFDGAVDPCQDPAAANPGTLRDRCIATGVPAAVVGTNYGSGSTSFPGLRGGNPNLEEERAKTWTVGAVFTPSFLPNFSATVDYFNFKIDNIIGRVGVQNIVTACYQFGQFCNQIERGSSGEFQRFIDTNINAAEQTLKGIDVGANYRLQLGDLLGGGGQLDFRFSGTYTIESDYTPVPGLPIINECAGAFGRNCGQPTPKWGHALRTTYSNGPFLASLLWRYIGPVDEDDPSFIYATEHLTAHNYFDATLGWDVADNMQMRFTVRNLFDNMPNEIIASNQQGGPGSQSNTYPETYDVLGRYFGMSVRIRY